MSGMSKQNSDVGVVRNELSVEVGKTKERFLTFQGSGQSWMA